MNDQAIRDLLKPLKKLAKVPPARLGGVACFIVKNGAIVSSGINYNPTGEPMEDLIGEKFITRPEVVHAEIAALTAAKKNNVDVAGATMLLTMSPCIRCAEVIAKSGLDEVVYMYEWWDKAGLDIVRSANILTKGLKEPS